MSPIVNTFIVGMPKAGTTSLHRYLAEHPDTCMAADKEPHYFSTDLLKEGEVHHGFPKYTRYPNIDAYHGLFAHRGSASVVGESSVFYLFSKQAAAEIHAYNPHAKIIILLREPVAFLYSLHSQGLYSGNETEADFAKALALEEKRRQGMYVPATVHFPSRLYYREHLRLAEQIQRFKTLFPAEQLYIRLFDDFKQHTALVVGEVFDFLRLDRSYQPDLINHNANTRMKSQRIARMIQDPSHPITATAKKMLPRFLWKKGKVWLKALNTDHSPREKLDPETEMFLRELALPEVQKLDKLLENEVWYKGDLLGRWGYHSTSHAE